MTFISLIFMVLCAVAADKGGCDFADALSDSAFSALVNKIKAKSFSDDKLAVLKQFAANNTYGLSSNQTVVIITQLSMTSDRVKAINIVSNFILTLECSGIVSLLKSLAFSSDKMEALKVVINLANQADLKMYNASIVTQFSLSGDQAQARNIIEKSKPRSCLFGPANIPLFAFIIDVSGSMQETFKDQDGTIYSRLGYVQKDLQTVMNSTLQPTQEFNIIQFSTSASAWKPGIVPASPANIASASTYVRSLRPGGGTNMLTALKLAFQDTRILGVYFLSDGEPNDNQAAILQFCNATKKFVNTIAFKASPVGAKFLLKMAELSHGSFRNIV